MRQHAQRPAQQQHAQATALAAACARNGMHKQRQAQATALAAAAACTSNGMHKQRHWQQHA
jgi:ribosomal protein L36